MDTFRKKSGTTDLGKGYEDCFIGFLALTSCINYKIQDFTISSNDANYGCFDDVVFQITFKDNKNRNFAMQLKHHHKASKPITKLSLASKTGDLSLQKYFDCFKTLNVDNFDYILYTNRTLEIIGQITFQLKGKEYIEVRARLDECSETDLLNTSDNRRCIVKFEVVGKEVHSEEESEISAYITFFSKFSLYVNQKNVEEMKSTVLNEFEDEYLCDQGSAFINFISEWSQRDGYKKKLNKQSIELKICEILLSPFIRIPTVNRNHQQSQVLGEVFKQFDVTVCENIDNLSNLWREEEELVEDHIKSKIRIIGEKFGLISGYNIDGLKKLGKVKILWHLNIIPLIIGVTDLNKTVIQRALHLCESERRVVLVGENINNIKFPKVSVFRSLHDLDGEYYVFILEQFTCSLQGRKTVPLKKIINDDSELRNLITPTHLIEMLNGTFSIGKRREKLPKNYVVRYLPKILIKPEFVKYSRNLSVISYCGRLDRADFCFGIQSIEINGYLNNDHNSSGDNYDHFIFHHKNKCTEEEFRSFCEKNPGKACHHFQVTKRKNLQLISSNNIEVLRTYQFYDESVQDSEIFNLATNKFNIICGEAGMGKTVLLAYLNKNYPFNCWIISLNFREHFIDLKEVEDNKILDYVFKLDGTNYNLFENKVRKYLPIVILWDGFDELPTDYLSQAVNILKKLANENIVQWVTVRPHLKTFLENEFNVFALIINEFTKKQQENYIKERLVKVNVNDEELVASVSQKIFKNIEETQGKGFLALPMQLYMLTDLFINNRPKYLNLLEGIFSLADMYHYFFEEKLNFLFTKTNYDSYNLISISIRERYKYSQLQFYEMLALKIHFNEDIFPFFFGDNIFFGYVEMIEIGGDYLEIVRKNENGRFIFVHNSFGEYFAALWLSKNFQKLKKPPTCMFEEKSRNIRLIFDMILAKNCPAHLAVLYKNLDTLKKYKDSISLKDKGFRNPLHLMCSWGERHNFLDTKLVGGKSVINLQKVSVIKATDAELNEIFRFLTEESCDPFEKDKLFQWNALDYAHRTLSLRPLDLIISRSVDTNFKELLKFDDVSSVIFYSVRLDYQSLFEIVVDRIPYFEDEVTHANLFHLCVEHGRYNFLLRLLEMNKYCTQIDKRRLAQTDVFLDIPKFNLSHLTLPSFTLELKNFFVMEISALDSAATLDRSELAEMLLKKNASVNKSNNSGMTPLHWAACKGHLKVAKLLINRGADINKSNAEGYTPLHMAAFSGSVRFVEFLLNLRWEHLESNSGLTPLDLAAHQGFLDIVKIMEPKCDIVDVNRSLLFASSQGQIKIIKYLVNKVKVKINFQYNKKTALHCASENGYLNIVKFLINKKATINTQDGQGRSALHYSAMRGFLKIIKFLIEHDCDVNVRDNEGQTPLHYAVTFGDVKVVEFLYENGADLMVIDKKGNTPKSLSAKENNAITQFLNNCLNKT